MEKRVGADLFLDKIADIPKHESFNKGNYHLVISDSWDYRYFWLLDYFLLLDYFSLLYSFWLSDYFWFLQYFLEGSGFCLLK